MKNVMTSPTPLVSNTFLKQFFRDVNNGGLWGGGNGASPRQVTLRVARHPPPVLPIAHRERHSHISPTAITPAHPRPHTSLSHVL